MRTQNIHFVTGKGGVGKSSFALALASHFALKGQNVLLAELGIHSFYQDFLQIHVGYKPTIYKPNLSICLWTGKDCLKEYALHLLKLESIYKLFFENNLSRSLIDIAPSLPELSILGKITSGIRQVGPSLPYDTIVVDAYATGHMMALLKAPRGMMEAVPLGPMGEQTRSIIKIIQNKNICKYWIVTLPEELPVTETLELQEDLLNEIKMESQIVLNKVLPADEINSFQTNDLSEKQFLQALKTKVHKEKLLKEKLIGWNLKSKILDIPFVYETNNLLVIDQMQKSLTLTIEKEQKANEGRSE